MHRLLRLLLLAASNLALTLAVSWYVAGQLQIVTIQLNTPLLATAIAIDQTGITASRGQYAWNFSLSSQAPTGEHPRWERMNDCLNGWRNFGCGYHNGQVNALSDGFGMLGLVTPPSYGVTHTCLLTFSSLFWLIAFRKSLTSLYKHVCPDKLEPRKASADHLHNRAG